MVQKLSCFCRHLGPGAREDRAAGLTRPNHVFQPWTSPGGSSRAGRHVDHRGRKHARTPAAWCSAPVEEPATGTLRSAAVAGRERPARRARRCALSWPAIRDTSGGRLAGKHVRSRQCARGSPLPGVSLSSAVHTHALCVHRQDRIRRRHRRAGRRRTAAQWPPSTEHTLHTHALRRLIRPRETRIFDTSPSANPLVRALCIRKSARRTSGTSGGGWI